MPLCAGEPAIDAETAAGRAAVRAATAAFGVVADGNTAIAADGLQLLLPWPSFHCSGCFAVTCGASTC